MLFVGGLMMAVAIEKWNLHKRMALLVLMTVGSRPMWLLLGFMGTTAFLSMWISNTATAAMMLPIAHAVLEEIREENEIVAQNPLRQSTSGDQGMSARYVKNYNSTTHEASERVYLELSGNEAGGEQSVENDMLPSSEEDSVTRGRPESQSVDSKLQHNQSEDLTGAITIDTHNRDNKEEEEEEENFVAAEKMPEHCTPETSSNSVVADKRFKRLTKGLMLGVAYAANIGGTATLTGTGPNIVLGEQAREFGVNFGLWFIFATPAMILALVVAWIYLSILYCDNRCVCVYVYITQVNHHP